MMKCVDRGGFPRDPADRLFEKDRMFSRCVFRKGRNLAGEVLDECASTMDIHGLESATDAKYRFLKTFEQSEQTRFERHAFVRHDGVFPESPFPAVQAGIDVGSGSGEEQSVKETPG